MQWVRESLLRMFLEVIQSQEFCILLRGLREYLQHSTETLTACCYFHLHRPSFDSSHARIIQKGLLCIFCSSSVDAFFARFCFLLCVCISLHQCAKFVPSSTPNVPFLVFYSHLFFSCDFPQKLKGTVKNDKSS